MKFIFALFTILFLSDLQAQQPLSLGLVGTIVRAEAAQSIATVVFTQTKSTEAYRDGSQIGSLAKILKIERDRLLVRNLKTGKPETISLGAFNSQFAVSKQVMDAPGRAKEFHVRRSLVDSTLTDLPKFLQDARAVPIADAAGNVTGFKLESIRPGSLYEKLGLQNGDILREVNGIKLDSVARALEIFNQFQSSSMIRLSTDRGGKPLELTYLIRE